MASNPMLNNLMQQAAQMQERMKKAQEELTELVATGKAGGARGVTAEMNGRHDLLKLTIHPSLVEDGDVEMLQDITVAAVNDAVRQIEAASKDKVLKLTEGMDLGDLQGETE